MANTTNFTIEKPNVGGARNQWGGIQNVATDKIDELLALALPVGTIQMYVKSTAPVATANGGTWLVCDGSGLIQANYPALYAIIGQTYGDGGNSSTHFNIPDLRARVPVGYNVAAIGSGVTVRSIRAMAATSGGTEGHILTTAELAAHSHAIPATSHKHDIDDATHTHTGNASGNTSTGSATTGIGIPDHSHEIEGTPSWGGHTHYRPEWGPGPEFVTLNTKDASITPTDPGHSHSLTTTPASHGITETEQEVTGILSTAPDTGSNSSHNNMQPYQVVNYIILAKHPTF